MKILFTRSNRSGSRLIRWATGEEMSHCAILVGDREKIVLHSTFGGVTTQGLTYFRAEQEVVAELEIHPGMKVDISKVPPYLNSNYDYPAFIWFAIRVLAAKLFGLEFKRTPSWEQGHMFLCTELVDDLVFGEEKELLTPGELHDKILFFGGTPVALPK